MNAYLIPLKNKFEENRNPEDALAMKRYMKGQFDYFGLKSPLRRELSKMHMRTAGLPDEDEFELVIFDCWSEPEREFQYFAMELAARVAKKAEVCRVEIYEFMAVNKSWWDTIDFIASNLVGEHFKRFPDLTVPYTEGWMDSGNMWLQRIALLFQLKYRKRTDLDLLTRYIERLSGSKEFFINKAIGWILREYSKTDADWVVNYVNENEGLLAPLSKREALKWLEKQNRIIVS